MQVGAVVRVGPVQYLAFVEGEEALPEEYDGHHICVYLTEEGGWHDWLSVKNRAPLGSTKFVPAVSSSRYRRKSPRLGHIHTSYSLQFDPGVCFSLLDPFLKFLWLYFAAPTWLCGPFSVCSCLVCDSLRLSFSVGLPCLDRVRQHSPRMYFPSTPASTGFHRSYLEAEQRGLVFVNPRRNFGKADTLEKALEEKQFRIKDMVR